MWGCATARTRRHDLLRLCLLAFLPAIGGCYAGAAGVVLGVEPSQRFFVGAGPRWAAVGDIDGDGRNDIVVANGNASTLSVFRAR